MRIQIRVKATGQTGTMDDSEFDPNVFERIETQLSDVPTANPVPQEDLATKIGKGVVGMVKNTGSQFARTGKNIVGAAVQTPMMLAEAEIEKQGKDATVIRNIREKIAPVGLSEKEFEDISTDGRGAVLQQLKDSMGIGSYAIPFGKGASFLTKATIPGMAVGALQKMSEGGKEHNATAEEIVGSSIIGGAGSTALYGATQLPKIFKKTGKGLESVGESTIQSQYNLPRSVAREVKLRETIQKLSDYGLSNIDDVQKASDMVNNVQTKIVRDSIARANPVDLSGLDDVAKGIIKDPDIMVGQDKKLLGDFISKIRGLLDVNSPNNVAQPLDVWDVIHALERKGYSYGKGRIQLTQADKAMRDAYVMMADELKDRLFVNSGADDMVVSSIANSEALKKLAVSYPQIAADLAKQTTVGGVRSVAGPLTRGSIAADLTEQGANLATETMGGAVKGIGKLAQNPLNILAVPLSNNRVNSASGQVIRNTGKAIGNMGNLPSIGLSNPTGQMSSRLPNIVSSASVPVDQPAQQPEPANASPNNYQESNNIQGNTDHTLPNISLTGYSVQELGSAYSKAIMAGDNAAASKLKQMYDMEASYQKSNTAPPRKMNIPFQDYALIQNAQIAYKDLSNIMLDDPNVLAKSFIGGKTSILSRKYENAAYRLAKNITYLQTGKVITEREARDIAIKMLPWFGDRTDVVQYKLDAINKELGTYANIMNQSNSVGGESPIIQTEEQGGY